MSVNWFPLTCLAMVLVSMLNHASAAEPDGKRYVIIHADDAGMSHSVNMATIEAMERGIVSSASIMVPCPWFKEIAVYAKEHPEKDFGIHLTLNCEWDNYRWGPVAPRDNVPSLLDKEGYLWGSVPEVAFNAKGSEVETELRAQIQRALDFGVPITHLDTHMGAVVSRPDLIAIYVNLGIEFNVPVFFIRRVDVGMAASNTEVRNRGLRLVEKLDQHHLPVLDYMTQYYTKGSVDEKKEMYLKAIADTEPGVRYLILHCGYDNEELRAITSSSGLRDTDRRVFTDPDFIAAVKENRRRDRHLEASPRNERQGVAAGMSAASLSPPTLQLQVDVVLLQMANEQVRDAEVDAGTRTSRTSRGHRGV